MERTVASYINVSMNKNTQTVMDTCLDKKPERVGPIVVEDLRKDLFADFSAIASALPQDCVLFEKEHLRVYLRIRPFTTVENESGESQECVSIEPPDTVLLRAPRSSLSTRRQTSHSDGDKPVTQTTQRFQFSQVYGPDTTQRQMFDGTVKRLVRDVLEGGNSIVFTYGVTNAGKTFTFLGPESDGGILPRSLNVIFNSIEGRVYAQNNIKPHRCRDFTRLTKDQQDEESTNKRNLMRLSKESDFLKSTMSSTCRSTILEGSSLSDISDQGEGDSFCLDVDSHTKYSVWVSFCEIYNENIYDLLDPIPNGSHRRTVLRLSQDIKGNTFVKDLKWVQVNNSEEAYKVLKIGKKNQSFSCTKLNNVSSRSHSIFSIRILRIEDVGIPRVHTISELSLCDLAGSERCAKTQNKGVQLKEAGNINTSLLILGKCINALRLNQQAKFQQHVPFRESKLTHYLQGFFCGRGKACMIVNINQCASMYDETLNVLKFSAIAQKVVVLNIKPVPAIAPKRSARDVSLIINNAGCKNLWSRRESSMVAWETTLEDVQEDGDEEEDNNEEEESCDESMAEETILEAGEEDKTVLEDFNGQFALVEELREKLLKEEAEKLALESHIREEVTIEFMELFSKMESDYNERLAKEREIIEDRADKRLAILKNLVSKSVSKCASVTGDEEMTKEDKVELLEGIIDAMRDDLARIRRDAEAAQTCLVDLPESPGTVASLRKQMDDLSEELLKTQQQLNLKTNEIDQISMELKQLCGQLEDAKENLESQTRTFEALMEICHEKDDVITKLQEAIDQNSEAATRDTALVDSIKEEILSLKQNCKCMSRDGSSAEEGRNRHADVLENLDDQPALKKGSLEDERVILSGELEKLQAECHQKDMTISQLKKEHELMVQKLETVKGEIKRKNEDSDELKREKVSFEQTLQKLTDDLEEQTDDCEAVMASLEKERKETARLSKDNKALVNGIFQLQQTSQKAESSVKTLQTELIEQTERSANLLEELEAARALLKELEDKSNEKSKTIESSTLETERLQKEAEELKVSSVQRNNSKFHDTIDSMKRECESVVEQLLQKSQCIADLEQELNQVREQLSGQEELCSQLRHELETQRSEAQLNLQDYELEKGAYNEIMKSYSDLEKMAGHLKERIVDLEVQVQASGGSSERVVVLEKQLAEREAQCGALQARLEEAQRKLAQVEESPINKSKEKVIEDMRLALTEQERTHTEQEQILEAKVKEIEALSQELMSLKDSCLPKNMNSVRFSHVINCPGENVKQEYQQTEERLKLVNEQNEVEKQKCLEERAILMEGAEGPEQEESQCPAPELMRECQKEFCRSTLQTEEVKLSKQPSEIEEESGSVVEALKLEMQTLQERNTEKERKLRELQDYSNFQTQEVLDSPQVSTDGRRELRFPKLESQFTPLHPNKLNVRRQGENKSVNIKVTRSARKRKSNEMEKDPVESENKKNIKLRANNRVNMQSPTVLGVKTDQNKQQTPASLKGKKDGTFQKIGDFIQSSPTLLGGEAKTMMGIVNGRSTKQEKATSVKPKRTKRKLYKTDISSPLDIPSHPIIGLDQDEKESDHLIIRRQLRSRTARK